MPDAPDRPLSAAEFLWSWDHEGKGVTFHWPDGLSVQETAAILREAIAHQIEADAFNALARADARRAYRNQWIKRREAADPAYRLHRRISKQIWDALLGNKESRRWELLVGYSASDLRAHLAARFTEGMTWQNMGRWHIDHIRPLASFTTTGPDCPEFRAAWALENLQPLWAKDNLVKGARWKP